MRRGIKWPDRRWALLFCGRQIRPTFISCSRTAGPPTRTILNRRTPNCAYRTTPCHRCDRRTLSRNTRSARIKVPDLTSRPVTGSDADGHRSAPRPRRRDPLRGRLLLCFGWMFRSPVPKTSLPARLIVRAATSALVDVQRRALWRVHPLIRDACEHPVCVGKADH